MYESFKYLKFLALSELIIQEVKKSGIGVDLTALKILECIAIAHFNNKPLNISNAKYLIDIAAEATISRKLNVLVDAGLIEKNTKNSNKRTKYLIPTALADDYFERLGDVLIISNK